MLIDTSVWIEYLAPRTRVLSEADREGMAHAIRDGEVSIVLPIYGELCSGARHGDAELRTLLSALRFVDLDWRLQATWERVAELGQAAFTRRVRIPGLVDRMILAAAQEADEVLWALDGPLRRLALRVGVHTR